MNRHVICVIGCQVKSEVFNFQVYYEYQVLPLLK